MFASDPPAEAAAVHQNRNPKTGGFTSMSAQTRIYVVESKSNIASDKGHRLVRASTPAQAMRHVAEGLFEVSIP